MIISELEKRIQDSIKGAKKNRVVLEDYDLEADIKCRLLLSEITQDEIDILEEILYSSLIIKIEKLAEELELSIEQVKEFVERFESAELYSIEGKLLKVNKDKRKYFETQLAKFDETFSPGMDFLQSLLKNVPIQVLPAWYQIPRSSNNIFESLVEKYLHTPRIYQRYVPEFLSEDSMIKNILTDLNNTPDYKLYVKDICKKYQISREELTEVLVAGEFNFLFCSSFEPQLDRWEEIVTPFCEWRDYLLYLQDHAPKGIEAHFEIDLRRNNEYAFIEDLASILNKCKEVDCVVLFNHKDDSFKVSPEDGEVLIEALEGLNLTVEYIDRIINKLLVLGLAVIEDEFLKPTDHASDWIAMPIEKRAHITFKHPHNFLDIQKISPLSTERSILEIQKSMGNIAKLGWVYFEDFLKGCPIEISDERKIFLKKQGRAWSYTLPDYTPEEVSLIRYTVMEWFFESGIVQSGICDGKECFKLTHLGRSIFT